MATPPLPAGLKNTRVLRVANQLHSAAIHLLRGARRADRDTGLTPERLSLLSVVTFAGPRTVSELADAEQVSSPAISRIVTGLEDAGLARRERADDDRRVVRVFATAQGRALLERARTGRLERIAGVLAQLDKRQLATLEDAAAVLESLTP